MVRNVTDSDFNIENIKCKYCLGVLRQQNELDIEAHLSCLQAFEKRPVYPIQNWVYQLENSKKVIESVEISSYQLQGQIKFCFNYEMFYRKSYFLEKDDLEYFYLYLDEIFRLTSIKKIFFSHLESIKIPDSIKYLKNLRSLLVVNCNFELNPNSFNNLVNFDSLKISVFETHTIPNEVFFLLTLKTLDLSDNKLDYLSSDIGNLLHLECLILLGNNLKHIPDSISNLDNLISLDLRNNPIAELPLSLYSIKNLKILHLEWTKLELLPDSLCKLLCLDHLSISNYQIPPKELFLKKDLIIFQIDENGNATIIKERQI